MYYTIETIQVGQIRVRFEDGSWALVPIKSDWPVEAIDHAVAAYDPENLPTGLNPNIEVGNVRVAKRIPLDTPEPIEFHEPAPTYSLDNVRAGYLPLALYYEAQGNTVLKDWLFEVCAASLQEWGITDPQQIINAHRVYETDVQGLDIFEEATRELLM